MIENGKTHLKNCVTCDESFWAAAFMNWTWRCIMKHLLHLVTQNDRFLTFVFCDCCYSIFWKVRRLANSLVIEVHTRFLYRSNLAQAELWNVVSARILIQLLFDLAFICRLNFIELFILACGIPEGEESIIENRPPSSCYFSSQNARNFFVEISFAIIWTLCTDHSLSIVNKSVWKNNQTSRVTWGSYCKRYLLLLCNLSFGNFSAV